MTVTDIQGALKSISIIPYYLKMWKIIIYSCSFCSFTVGARKLNSLVNCTPRAIKQFPRDLFTQKQRADGAVLFHILVSAYMFAAFAYICEDYFVPSLEIMSDGKRKTKEIINISFFILVFLQSRSALNYLFQNWIFISFLSAVCDLKKCNFKTCKTTLNKVLMHGLIKMNFWFKKLKMPFKVPLPLHTPSFLLGLHIVLQSRHVNC